MVKVSVRDMDSANVSFIILNDHRARAYGNALRSLRNWRSDFEAQGFGSGFAHVMAQRAFPFSHAEPTCRQISQDLNQMQHFKQKVAPATISQQDCPFHDF